MPGGRALALRVLLLVLALGLFLGTGEAALRLLYRDQGRTTLGGPGERTFEHLTIRDDQRGRFDTGPKRPGVPRIMILGDSITYGQGVRDWRDVWPEQLAAMLERAGQPHEMAVLATPGRDIPTHVREFERWAPEIQPDILIYQWYINDVEVLQHRPRNLRWWQQFGWHRTLQRSSYLYWFVDNRFSVLLPQPERSYVEYILEDFIPGSLEWAEFERQFHTLATRAKEVAPGRLLVLYPQVPFRGQSPLKPIFDRLHVIAGAHRLLIPPAAWQRSAGRPATIPGAPWNNAIELSADVTGPVIETAAYYLSAGAGELVATIQIATPGNDAPPVARIELVDDGSGEVLAAAPLAARNRNDQWQAIPIRFELPGEGGRPVRFRVVASGGITFAIGSLELPVDYGMRVVDLTDALNAFDTHASIFDAHPNARAHRVIAEEIRKNLPAVPPRN